MSIGFLYRIFNKPKTFDEFMDKIRRKGIKRIDLVPVMSFKFHGNDGYYHCYTELFAEGIRFKTPEYHSYVFSPNARGAVENREQTERMTRKEAIWIVKRLSSLGFEVSIGSIKE